jgi:hypothetical protein
VIPTGMPPPRESAVFQLVRANHEQAEQGHKRLREDVRDQDERLAKVEKLLGEHSYKLQTLAVTSPDLSKTRLSAGTVVVLLVAVAGIIAGQVTTTWGVKSDMRDITTQLNLLQKLQDERSVTMNQKTDGIDKKQELLRIQVDDLRKEFDRRFQKR